MTAMILLIVLSVLPLIAATGWPWNGRYDYRRNKIERRDPLACLAEAPTNIWSTCASFLDEYQVNLPHLVKMNPELQNDCLAFSPGTTYCLLRDVPLPKSTNGACSRNEAYGTCVGSGFGDCCGKTGQCGSTAAFCAIGNCIAGNCPGLGYSTDGFCGDAYRGLMCGGSLGTCCSNAGRCGSTSAECGIGNCQSGACVGVTTTPTTTATPIPLPSPNSPSPDGTCGFQNKYRCTGTAWYYGSCCSAAGFCGISDYHCSDLLGCQLGFGLCDKTNLQTTVITVTPSSSSPGTSSSTSSPPASSSTTSPVPSSTSSSTTTSSAPISTSSSSTTIPSSSSTTTSSTSSVPSPPGSVCIRGTGIGNLLGLCDYCCHWGYCPSGSCTCLEYGNQIPPPVATWPAGYPAPGLDSSYLGLCSYACNHGYCPAGACTTTPP